MPPAMTPDEVPAAVLLAGAVFLAFGFLLGFLEGRRRGHAEAARRRRRADAAFLAILIDRRTYEIARALFHECLRRHRG